MARPQTRRFGFVDFDAMKVLPSSEDDDQFVCRRGNGDNVVVTRADIIAGSTIIPDPLLLGNGSAADPTYSFLARSGSGVFSPVAAAVAFAADGEEAVRYTETLGRIMQSNEASVGLTASDTQTQGQQQLFSSYNQISVCATANDVATLPEAAEGNWALVINDGAETLQLFPAADDNLGQGVDTSTTIVSGSSQLYFGIDAINWKLVGINVGGSGDVIKVGTPVNNQVGIWTGDGTLEGDANLTFVGGLLSPNKIKITTGTQGAPSIGIGDATTGFYRPAGGELGFSSLGSEKWRMSAAGFFGQNGAGNSQGAQLVNTVPSATNPTIRPSGPDGDNGLGMAGTNHLSLIAGALDCITLKNTAGARQVGFYVTAPISLQTGVAVDSAGIHAALVALGLITA